MSRHALIAGGTGFIGRNLVKHLRAQNYDITVISRMPGVNHMHWHELERLGLPRNITAVVNLCGQNVLDPRRRWTAGFKQNVWNSRINTSAALAKAIGASAPQVEAFVNISGVSHYRPHEERVYSEDDAVDNFDFMSKLCLEWEKAATLPAPAVDSCRAIKLRTGVVVGVNGGIVESMRLPFQLGLGGPMGSGNQILPWIHMQDLCRLIQHCIESANCAGPLNAVAPHIVTNAEFSQAFAKALHRPCLFAVPEMLVELLFGRDRAALLLSGAKIQPKRTLASGFVYDYSTVKAACDEVAKKL